MTKIDAEREAFDFRNAGTGAFLAECADNAERWAEAFMQITKGSVDKSDMIGWFANAIENAETVRRSTRALQAANALPVQPKVTREEFNDWIKTNMPLHDGSQYGWGAEDFANAIIAKWPHIVGE